MKRLGLVALSCVILLASAGDAAAQIAGSTRLGVTVEEMRAVAVGWSAKKQILRQPVYNEQTQKVGTIDDLIIAPDTSVSFVRIRQEVTSRPRERRLPSALVVCYGVITVAPTSSPSHAAPAPTSCGPASITEAGRARSTPHSGRPRSS